jgi:hypothetical protein
MPEISLFLFDLEQLFKLFPKQDGQLKDKIQEYEQKTQEDMAEIRIKLFSEFGYKNEFDEVAIW